MIRGCRKLHDETLRKVELTTRYHSGEEIKENEMGGTCGTYGRRGEKYMNGFGGQT